MTFLSGFAEGFTNERNRRLDREAQKEDIAFKYKFDALREKKTKWEEKKAKESQMAKQAAMVAEAVGDREFAGVAMEHLSAGVSFDSLLEDARKGKFQRDPNATNTKTVDVASTAMPSYDSLMETTKPTTAMPEGVEMSENQEVAPKRKWYEPTPIDEKVDARIDEIDPEIRKASKEYDSFTPKPVDTGGWLYKDDTKVKVGTPAEALFELDQARIDGDPAKIKVAQMKVAAHTAVARLTRVVKPDEGDYAIVDENGNLESFFIGRLDIDPDNPGQERVFNVSDGNPSLVTTRFKKISPEVMKEYSKVSASVGDRVEKYTLKTAAYAKALDTVSQIDQVLARNPQAAKKVSEVAVIVRSVGQEVEGLFSIIQNQTEEGKQSLEQGNLEGAEASAKAIEDSVTGLLSKPNRTLAEDAVLLEGLRVSQAFQLAAANGQTGQGVSTKDYENFYKMGGGTDKDSIRKAALSNLTQIFTGIESERIQLDSNPEIKSLDKRLGFKSGLRAPRIGDMLIEQGRENLLKINKEVTDIYQANSNDANRAAQADGTLKPTEVKTINSKEDYDNLPSGAKYIAPDGKERVKK